ncbi:DUF4209 domain-containing protein [Methylobacterium fujisawaense]|uniref:DUF4209 domain-containing protein n=1 Tax=Methylobacterium fujisawaense TaxID=107400 RepID=UPI003CFB8F03
MSEANSSQSPFDRISVEDFTSIDYEEPISGINSVGYHDLSNEFQKARELAQAHGDNFRANIYAVLSTVCGFHFKPGDRGAPYGPMQVLGDGRRTLIPSDFRGDQANAFGTIAAQTKNPALRARLADVAWLCRRSDAESKTIAIRGLNESVTRVLRGEAHFDGGEQGGHIWQGVQYLQRALAIARTKGTDTAAEGETRALVVHMRDLGFRDRIPSIFGRSAKLDLNYGVSDPLVVADQAREFAEYDETRGDQDGARRNWLVAAEAYEITRNAAEQSACLIKAAECHVRDAASAGSVMGATGSLMRAIEQYREVPRQFRPSGRLEQLQADLVAKQAGLNDEMGTYEYSEDITKEVNQVLDTYTGKSLADCLLGLALIGKPSGIEDYRDQIRKNAQEFAFMSMIDSTVHDAEGKIVSHIPAIDLSRDITDDDVRHRCAQLMSFEHQSAVQVGIRPVTHLMMSEHTLDEELFTFLAHVSDFVPPEHEKAFGLGLSRFFSGASMEACCLLVPQLENSLRYVLKQTGTDVSKITNASTQEDVMLSVLLDRFRAPLEAIFGAAHIFQVEMLFQNRSGFNIRNSLAHGTTKDNEFWSASHIFACWLIYRLMLIPLISKWDRIKAILADQGYD